MRPAQPSPPFYAAGSQDVLCVNTPPRCRRRCRRMACAASSPLNSARRSNGRLTSSRATSRLGSAHCSCTCVSLSSCASLIVCREERLEPRRGRACICERASLCVHLRACISVRVCACACYRACMRAVCVRACVRTCARVCICVCVRVHARQSELCRRHWTFSDMLSSTTRDVCCTRRRPSMRSLRLGSSPPGLLRRPGREPAPIGDVERIGREGGASGIMLTVHIRNVAGKPQDPDLELLKRSLIWMDQDC